MVIIVNAHPKITIHISVDLIKKDILCVPCDRYLVINSCVVLIDRIQKLPQDQLLVAIINAIENNLVNPDEVVNNENISENSICEKHQKKNEYFCFRHKEFVCDDCTTLFVFSCNP
jgi:hypothetical protein